MVVVDASALGAMTLNEPEGGRIAARLGEHQLHAPRLLDLELASAAWKTCRKAGADQERILAALAGTLALPIKRHDIPPMAALALALEAGLTVYDAAYLWLARDLGAPLVTLDTQLNAAAKRYL